MKKIPVILLMAFFAMPAIYGQIKIGDNPQAISPTSVLELESNDRVLVITRINTAQMDAIVPDQGAMIYNTDTQCIHYYDGGQWVNLCNSAGLAFTTDPIENDVSTIVITDQAGTKNFEVAPNSIGSLQIINGGINGVDIQNGSIGPGKLQNQSVTQDKLSENSVGAFALDNANINLSDFFNDEGFITSADIISAAAGNDIVNNGGAFYDDQVLQDNIAANALAISNIGVPTLNEVLQEDNLAGSLQIKGLAEPTDPADAATKAYVDAQGGGGSDDQNLTGATLNAANELTITIENGNPATVDLSSLAGGTGSTAIADQTTITGVGTVGDPFKIEPGADGQILTTTAGNVSWETVAAGGNDGVVSNVEYTAADNNLTFTGANGGFNGVINLDDLDGGGGANQNLAQVLTQGNDGGAALIKNILDPVDPQDAATRAYVLATVASGGGLADGSILIGGAGDVAQQLAVMGDATLANDGTLTISNDAINNAKIIDGAVSNNKIAPGAADQILRTASDGLSVQWVDLPTGSAVLTDMTLTGDGSSAGTALSLADNAVNSVKIENATILAEDLADMGATDGQILKWNDTAMVWELADDDTGTATLTDGNIFVGGTGDVPTDVTLGGDATIDNAGALTIADDAVELSMLAPPDPAGTPTPADGQIMVWDNTVGEWVIDAQAGEHVGMANSIFYADDVTGAPTEDNDSFAWDPTIRLGFGQLQVGLDGNTAPTDVSKVVIAETPSGGTDVMFPLLIQTSAPAVANASTGILFSPETHGPGTLAKGALIYQRTGDWAIGDFHFLQTALPNLVKPTTADKAFTIKNNKDIQLYGNIIDKNGVGATQPPPAAEVGLVLTNTATGAQWAAPTGGGAGEANTASNIGTAGVGIWANKNLVDLQFKNINGLDTNIITVTDDAANNEIDLDIRDESIDPTTKIVPESATPANNKMLITDTSGNVVWDDVPSGTGNLGNTNLTQIATEDRTYNLSGRELIFTGPGGQIGIGDFGGAGAPASVRSKLDVDGQITASNGFAATEGTVGTPAYSFFTNGDTNTGIYRAGEDQLGFSTEGLDVMRMDEDQEVGIGTTAPDERLHIDGNLRIDNGDIIARNGAATTVGHVLTNTINGTEWAPAGGLPAGGTVGQVLSTDGAATPTYSWVNNDDQVANEVTVAATPTNYTAGTTDVEAHLVGIDAALATSSLPAGGTVGQVLSTDGAATPTYSWIDDDDDQEANDIDYNNGTSGLAGILVQDAVDELAANRIIAKGRVTGGGASGNYTETVAGGIPAGAIINLTVEQTGTGNPIMIQLVSTAAGSFVVQINEWDGTTFVGTNAAWNYTIVNP